MFHYGCNALIVETLLTAKSALFRQRPVFRSRSVIIVLPVYYFEFLNINRSRSRSSFCSRHFGSISSPKDLFHRSLNQSLFKTKSGYQACSVKTLTTGPVNTIVLPRSRSSIKRVSVSSVDNSRLSYSTITTTTGEMAQSSLVVGHDESNHCFYISLEDNSAKSGPSAKLEYEWIRPNHVDLYHTEVPPQFRGQGVAKILAKAAFDHFSEKNITIRPSCTYLQKYLKENPVAIYLDRVEKHFVDKIKSGS